MKRDEFLHLFGFGAALLLTGCLGSCSSNTDDPQPGTTPGPGAGAIDFTLDVADPANARLNDPVFGYVYGANDQVIVAKTTAGSYVALSAACTHQGTSVQFQPGSSNFRCPNHGSLFSLGGAATQGPAVGALRSYTVAQTGSVLRITG
ncbi:Rieske (2Fe-2S) protein [Hymenobacter sp.]|uniref:Rieske (2Fe-2S) protein n=1 Tax=Hymenobacter sp. TaxID=1898978 RepID=UPI00286B2C64|nr:Rieske (2Fe-2S) protein [Hymenobacter sp.]